MIHRGLYAAISFTAVLLSVIAARHPADVRAAAFYSPAAPPAFPDSTDGFKAQLAEILKAFQTDDSQTVARLLGEFSLQETDVWMSRQFGQDRSVQMVGAYGHAVTSFATRFRSMLERSGKLANVELEVATIEPLEIPAGVIPESELRSPAFPVQIQTFRFRLAVRGQGPAPLVNCFVYQDGAFRVLGGSGPFWIEDPLKIIIEHANVQRARLIHMDPPEYPIGARATGVEGVVILHAIVGKDGKVRDLSLISGNPVFVKAAMKAVSRWRYEPTRLNGQPVEVDTSISVIFSLHGNH